jgi:hypothetical protein
MDQTRVQTELGESFPLTAGVVKPITRLLRKQRTLYLQVNRGNKSPTTGASSYSRGSGYASPSESGYMTPRELKEEQWRLEAEATARPGKVEMRGMYKELGGRKSRSKVKLGSSGGVRDKGGWGDGEDW